MRRRVPNRRRSETTEIEVDAPLDLVAEYQWGIR
jgi:hypothetical protein